MLKYKNYAPFNKYYSLELFLCCWEVCVKQRQRHRLGFKKRKELKVINSHFLKEELISLFLVYIPKNFS